VREQEEHSCINNRCDISLFLIDTRDFEGHNAELKALQLFFLQPPTAVDDDNFVDFSRDDVSFHQQFLFLTYNDDGHTFRFATQLGVPLSVIFCVYFAETAEIE